MQNSCKRIDEMQDLRRFVFTRLCEENDFEVDAYRTTEQVLKRKGKLCGILFCLHGPRSVKLTAVWELENDTVLFYQATGQRSKRVPVKTDFILNDRIASQFKHNK